MKIFKTILALSLLLAACTSDVDIKLKPENRKLVLNSLISPDKTISVSLTTSVSLFDKDFPVIENAAIRLFENNVYIGNLEYLSEGNYVIDYNPKGGKTYSLVIEAEGFDPIEAEETLPKSYASFVRNFSFEYPTSYIDGSVFGTVKFDLSDDSDSTTNYYEIILVEPYIDIEGKTTAYFSNMLYVHNEAISLKNWEPPYPNTLLFTNDSFRGKTLHFSIFKNNSASPIVKIRRVSPAYYKYKTTLYEHRYNQLQEDSGDILKGDPVKLYGNIQGGYGIFASYFESIYEPIR